MNGICVDCGEYVDSDSPTACRRCLVRRREAESVPRTGSRLELRKTFKTILQLAADLAVIVGVDDDEFVVLARAHLSLARAEADADRRRES